MYFNESLSKTEICKFIIVVDAEYVCQHSVTDPRFYSTGDIEHA